MPPASPVRSPCQGWLALWWDEAPRLAIDSCDRCGYLCWSSYFRAEVPKAKGLEYLPKSPATLFVWALWRSLACKPVLCPQVNSRIVIFPGLSLMFWINKTLSSPVRQWHEKPFVRWRLCPLCPAWAGWCVCPCGFGCSPPVRPPSPVAGLSVALQAWCPVVGPLPRDSL